MLYTICVEMGSGSSTIGAAGEQPVPPVLWEPSAATIGRSRIAAFIAWLHEERGLHFADYEELRRWSVADLEGFWSAIWEFFGVRADGSPTPVLGSEEMPGAEWFPAASLNYVEHLLEGRDEEATAIVHASELRELDEMSFGELRRQVGAVAEALRRSGVGRGDRVVAYMPNVPEAVVALLATASIGAVWSSCSPDFGPRSVIDRFAQIEPKVLIAVDGYRYGGKDFDRLETVAALQEALPGLERTIVLPYLDLDPDLSPLAPGTTEWAALLAEGEGTEPRFERVPFDHPLWVLYSSGTTGLPKAIVQGHGGILLEHLKTLNFHVDAGSEDRLLWFTTTGWMMWNFLVSGLLTGAAIVLFDGNPGYPDLGRLWDLADQAGITILGASAAYFSACMKAGVVPREGRGLEGLRAIGSTGSPLSADAFEWIYDRLGPDLWLFSISGGTDLCAPFVGGVPLLPVYRGEIQARCLGAAVEAWNDEGRPVIEEVGELVITRPMPSMPLYFWGDEDGSRYRESYFEMFPGVWRHGDWIEITDRGTAVIHGRSDSTINRGGIRMGTAEIYAAVLSLDQIVDALVVDIPRPGTDGWMPLFVVMREGDHLDDDTIAEIARLVREAASPRHVPDAAYEIAEVPRTLTGKALEVPVKRILMGMPLERALSRDSLANPAALDFFVEMAKTLEPTA